MKRHLRDIRAACAEVFARFPYLALAGVLAVAAFLFAVWFPNLELIGEIFGTPDVPAAIKLQIMLSLLGGIVTNFSPLSAGYTVAIAVLFGINTAMIVYLLKQKRAVAAGQNIAIGSGGVASGAIGIGCAACGSLVFSTVLSSFGAAGALALLPLQGEEFGILGVVLLLVSIVFMSRKIAAPVSCQPSPATPGKPAKSAIAPTRSQRKQ
jgi:hypothetical protein